MRQIKQYSLVLIFLYAAYFSYAQDPGTVITYTKISDTEGNFTGALDDNDHLSKCCNIGDINNDGITDMALGQASCNDGGTDKGAVWILFMKDDGTVNSHQKISSTYGNFTGILDNDDRFGTSIARLDDLDNDGVPDIAVGAYYDNDAGLNTGAVWILFLNSDGTVKSHQKISGTQGGIVGLTENRFFGVSLSSIGDLNNDGNTDIAVGSPQYDNDGGLYKGCVWILFLNSDGTVNDQQKINDYNGGLDVTLNDRDYFGYGISCIGDLDGDGVNDITATAIRDDDGGTDKGAIYILFLNNDGTVKSHQKISDTEGGFSGTLDNGDYFGANIASLGDVDGDSNPDIAVSSSKDDDGGTDKGAVYILFLNTDGTVKAQQKISDLDGGFPGVLDNEDYFGSGISFMGDINNDGNIELAVGANRDDDGGTDRGAVYILSLKKGTNDIGEYKELRSINVFPNPTAGELNVFVEQSFNVTISDITGKTILSKSICDKNYNSFDLSSLNKGVYFINFSNHEGSTTTRVIVQ